MLVIRGVYIRGAYIRGAYIQDFTVYFDNQIVYLIFVGSSNLILNIFHPCHFHCYFLSFN